MTSSATVMTGPAAGAIATVLLTGDTAQASLARIFRSANATPPQFETGCILLGHIVDGDESIDQVTIGCEGPESFAIHCHGNPLIVEAIMKLLERHGANLILPQQLFVASGSGDSIDDEARLALASVKTLAGARLIANGGLLRKLQQWRQQLESGSLGEIASQARQVLRDSETARLLIEGCTIALIGPAGAGKSTLLNTLAGREKAIVSGVKGTTRDWISAEIHLPPLAVTLIDTAGFVAAGDEIDQAAQNRSLDILDRADIVLLVFDVTEPTVEINTLLQAPLSTKKVIPILNKADLPEAPATNTLPAFAHAPIRISAKQGTGINELIAAVVDAAGAAALPPQTAIAFTARQRNLLERLSAASSCVDAAVLISETV